MHRLLHRQLNRHLGQIDNLPQEWQTFLGAVDAAYCQYDGDHAMIERSLELSSTELLQANSQLQTLLNEVEAQVTERTAELARTNTELKQTLAGLQSAQVQLIQAEKMSALGQLVAGIAHEINNPVNFIYGNLTYLREHTQHLLSLMQLFCQPDAMPLAEIQQQAQAIDLDYMQNDLPKLLNSMEIGTSRIREIVQSLRNFSRLDEAEYKAVNLHEGIESTLMILESRLSEQRNLPAIQVIRDYGHLPQVECYAGQLNQVFMNLLSNAIDALEESNRQRKLSANENEISRISIRTEMINQNYIRVSIIDNGVGIPDSLRSRLFDPFFTTKPVGKGTGLGLSISYQIVTEKHRGKLWCDSTPSQGTQFCVEIPVRQQPVSAR